MQKYGFDDARPVLERASARETAARVAIGEVARAFCRQVLGVEILSHVVALGEVSVPEGVIPEPGDLERIDADPVRCLDPDTSAAIVKHIEQVKRDGDTLGGVVEVVVHGLPPGLGSHVHWDRRLDSRLAAALMGVQAIKGVEVGDGFRTAARRGSQAHDEIVRDGEIRRVTNRAAWRRGRHDDRRDPAGPRRHEAHLHGAARTVHDRRADRRASTKAINQRSDVTAVPAAGVVAEAMVALVIAEAAVEKFGGDSVEETARNLQGYLSSLVIK